MSDSPFFSNKQKVRLEAYQLLKRSLTGHMVLMVLMKEHADQHRHGCVKEEEVSSNAEEVSLNAATDEIVVLDEDEV
ncbi:hypothetical protein L1987_35211 [Smallanthus sonchifolius]|uniref:Uncharacterized protein n=1 Tax=Smallanthus sonchifolius TaxID=185202 RepID=A0ACB9HX76_9ASTR|nr:hypothetical protein L1987_35211 [Smallanthus sonchifolius]